MDKRWFFWSIRSNWQDQGFLPITINQSKEQVIFSSQEAIEGCLLDSTSNKENLKTAPTLFDLICKKNFRLRHLGCSLLLSITWNF